jgi:segregation and condensation protein A
VGGPARPDEPIIQLPLFEGPLELLLSLVERRRLPITELSLAAVADQYLSQIRDVDTLDGDKLSDFLVLAARLVLIKSRALLPRLEPPADDELESTDDLVARLETYRAFKLLAAALAERESAGRAAFPSGTTHAPGPAQSDLPLEPFAPALLARLVAAVEGRRARPAAHPEPLPSRMTVEERLVTLRARLSSSPVVNWDEVAGDTVDEIVATVLAVLEMVRRGELQVDQPTLFGPIRLHLLDQFSATEGNGTSTDAI